MDAKHAKGAEHRNIGNYLYYYGALHLTGFHQIFSTNILRLCRFLIARDPTASGFNFS
jgi:hypothetical protein